jgi:uncharacterized membrane protein YbhN (UPF0104 family)
VARGLGVAVPLRTGVAAYYRSQFLNVATPGGVLGDVHRGLRHGRDVGDTGRGVRSVFWERCTGQAVQACLAVLVLSLLPSPVRRVVPSAAAALLVVLLALVVLVAVGGQRWASVQRVLRGRAARAAVDDVRRGVLARGVWPGAVLASGVAVTGHAATFLVAARSAGSTASVAQLLPLAMVVLLSMAVPLSVAGWGPREGVAAWVFGAAGLGADRGVAVAVVYGVMAVVASLPGAVVLVAGRLCAHRADPRPTPTATRRVAICPSSGGCGRG